MASSLGSRSKISSHKPGPSCGWGLAVTIPHLRFLSGQRPEETMTSLLIFLHRQDAHRRQCHPPVEQGQEARTTYLLVSLTGLGVTWETHPWACVN